MSEETLIWDGVVVVGLLLITQRRFWVVTFFGGGLASFFGMLASIGDFEMLEALGFFIIMAVCWFVMAAITRQTGRLVAH
jgi:hypothetical protein